MITIYLKAEDKNMRYGARKIYFEPIKTLHEAWKIIKRDYSDMQDFFRTYGHTRRIYTYEIWKDNELLATTTYDR